LNILFLLVVLAAAAIMRGEAVLEAISIQLYL